MRTRDNTLGMDPNWTPWPDASEGYATELSRIPSPRLDTLSELADYLNDEMSEQLELVFELLEAGVCTDFAKGLIFDLHNISQCLAAFIKTGHVPEINNCTSNDAGALTTVLREVSDGMTEHDGLQYALPVLARTLEYAVQARETADAR